MSIPQLDGITLPITTPMRDEEIALDALRDNIRRWCATPVRGFLVLGSTGEFVALDDTEKRAVLEVARAAIPAERPMLAGATAESTRGAIKLGRAAGRIGADAVLVGVPTYFASLIDEEALYRHYAAVADALEIPILLYSVPKFTGRELGAALVERLSRHGNIMGIKESGNRPERLVPIAGRDALPVRGARASQGTGDRGFVLLSGHAPSLARALQQGYAGGILAVANADPELCCALYQAARASDDEALTVLQPRIERLAASIAACGLGGLKKTIEWRGLYGGSPRSPLRPPDAHEERALRANLDGVLSPGVIGEGNVH